MYITCQLIKNLKTHSKTAFLSQLIVWEKVC